VTYLPPILATKEMKQKTPTKKNYTSTCPLQNEFCLWNIFHTQLSIWLKKICIEVLWHVLFDNQTWTNNFKLDFDNFGLNFENPQTCMTYLSYPNPIFLMC
jgi:hypothetical protein